MHPYVNSPDQSWLDKRTDIWSCTMDLREADSHVPPPSQEKARTPSPTSITAFLNSPVSSVHYYTNNNSHSSLSHFHFQYPITEFKRHKLSLSLSWNSNFAEQKWSSNRAAAEWIRKSSENHRASWRSSEASVTYKSALRSHQFYSPLISLSIRTKESLWIRSPALTSAMKFLAIQAELQLNQVWSGRESSKTHRFGGSRDHTTRTRRKRGHHSK